ncbi:MAG: DUF4296 domain-containing protein [Bacteroidota bacterium]|nr:DUF4296 domain-containing protein [Bacteroidota bacterium]
MKPEIILFIVLLFASCDSETHVPSDLLQPDKMTEVMEDIYLAEGIVATSGSQDRIAERQLAIDYYSVIYKKHKVDSAVFRKSFDYYTIHPKLMQQVSDQVIDKLSKENLELYKK